jgi:hypothetical protein
VAILRGCRLRPVEAVQSWLAAAEISAGPVFRPVLRDSACRQCHSPRTARLSGKDRTLSETHFPRSDMLIRDIIARGRHDGCGGRAGKAELLTGIEAASSRPVRGSC